MEKTAKELLKLGFGRGNEKQKEALQWLRNMYVNLCFFLIGYHSTYNPPLSFF